MEFRPFSTDWQDFEKSCEWAALYIPEGVVYKDTLYKDGLYIWVGSDSDNVSVDLSSGASEYLFSIELVGIVSFQNITELKFQFICNHWIAFYD